MRGPLMTLAQMVDYMPGGAMSPCGGARVGQDHDGLHCAAYCPCYTPGARSSVTARVTRVDGLTVLECDDQPTGAAIVSAQICGASNVIRF